MNRRDAGPRTYLLCGCIFSGVGAVLLAVGVLLFAGGSVSRGGFHQNRMSAFLPVLFLLMGLLMAGIGVGILRWWREKKERKNRLLQAGYFVNADITGFPIDYRVTVNGMPTYQVECSYQDPASGTVHIFRSDNVFVDPAYCVNAKTVRVYVDPKSGYREYYVDVDPILPNIQRH